MGIVWGFQSEVNVLFLTSGRNVGVDRLLYSFIRCNHWPILGLVDQIRKRVLGSHAKTFLGLLQSLNYKKGLKYLALYSNIEASVLPTNGCTLMMIQSLYGDLNFAELAKLVRQQLSGRDFRKRCKTETLKI